MNCKKCGQSMFSQGNTWVCLKCGVIYEYELRRIGTIVKRLDRK